MVHIIVLCALTLFGAEIIDKSQLILFTFSLKYGHRTVLPAIILAALITQGSFILVGHTLGAHLPTGLLKINTGVILLIFALKLFFDRINHRNEATESLTLEKVSRIQYFELGGLITIIVSIFVAELGDMTMFTTISFASIYPWEYVLIGTCLGIIFANVVAVLGARIIANKLNEKLMNLVAALVFIVYGIIMLFIGLNHYLDRTYSILIIVVTIVIMINILTLIYFKSWHFTNKNLRTKQNTAHKTVLR